MILKHTFYSLYNTAASRVVYTTVCGESQSRFWVGEAGKNSLYSIHEIGL